MARRSPSTSSDAKLNSVTRLYEREDAMRSSNEAGSWVVSTGVALLVCTFAVAGSTRAAGSELNAPPRPGMASSATAGVSAVLVDAYSGCSVEYGLAALNTDWPQFGTTSLSVTTGGALCAGQFTLSDLEESGADTVILDAVAGSYTLSQNEVDALQKYLEQGHTLVGLGDDFLWHKHVDNDVAPLFGLAEQSAWHATGSFRGAPPTYTLKLENPASAQLFKDVPNPYVSAAQGFDEKPTDKRWSRNDMTGASIVGLNPSHRVCITVYDGPGYQAVYIANDADYQSSTADLQFLYNALTYSSGSDASAR
jgi:hypothetical protein